MTAPCYQPTELVVGLDFDNTLAIYDELFHRAAVERGLVGNEVARTKKDVRDAVRALPEGETSWQKLQAAVYGARMSEAALADGVPEFFGLCGQRGAQVYIVSHKTQFAGYDDTGTDLRRSAMAWMSQQGFFDRAGMDLNPENVFFEGTRLDKLHRIKQLGCTHFIDDLEEVFSEEHFPPDVAKVLYAPSAPTCNLPGVAVAQTWNQVAAYVLGNES